MKTRLHFLDNLRTVLIFLVVVLHTGIVYEPILENTWIVSDPDKISSLGLLRMYLDIFVMFMIFYIAGYFVPASLKNKSSLAFVGSKAKRILLPWLVAVFTLIPAYKVIFLYSRGLPQEAWNTYFHLFQRAGGDPGYFADNPVQNWLWFLPVLFAFQVVYLLLSKTGVFKVKISLKAAVALTLVLGVAYGMLISQMGLMGWHHSALFHFQRERLLIYLLAFLLGSLSYNLKVFEAWQRNTRRYILANVVLSVSLGIFTAVALNLFFNMIDPGRNYYFVSPLVDRLAYYSTMLLSMLSFLYVLLYGFRASFNRSNRVIVELNKNSYGVYILHVVVLGVVSTLLLNTALPVSAKYLANILITFLVTNLLVSTYRWRLQKRLMSAAVRMAIPIIAVAIAVVVYSMPDEQAMAPVAAEVGSAERVAPETGIHMAVIEGRTDLVQQHINAGSDLNQPEPSGGSSPLILAALFGREHEAHALVEAGATVNVRNKEGSTALHTAAFFCHPAIVRMLLDHGADTTLRNNAGSTALEAVSGPFEDVKGFYEYFAHTLGPLGLELDYDRIEKTRPVIADIIRTGK